MLSAKQPVYGRTTEWSRRGVEPWRRASAQAAANRAEDVLLLMCAGARSVLDSGDTQNADSFMRRQVVCRGLNLNKARAVPSGAAGCYTVRRMEHHADACR